MQLSAWPALRGEGRDHRGLGPSSRPSVPDFAGCDRRVRSYEVLHKPFAKARSRYPEKGNRLSPLCTGALAPAGVGGGPNAGCCAGVSLALSCALVRVIATNSGSARRWRGDRGKGRLSTGPPGAGKARADSVDGLRGQGPLAARRMRASHAVIDYGLTMSCGEEARPWVGQPGNPVNRDAIAGSRAARKTRNDHRPGEQYERRGHG